MDFCLFEITLHTHWSKFAVGVCIHPHLCLLLAHSLVKHICKHTPRCCVLCPLAFLTFANLLAMACQVILSKILPNNKFINSQSYTQLKPSYDGNMLHIWFPWVPQFEGVNTSTSTWKVSFTLSAHHFDSSMLLGKVLGCIDLIHEWNFDSGLCCHSNKFRVRFEDVLGGRKENWGL
jgi:hypothetical protein